MKLTGPHIRKIRHKETGKFFVLFEDQAIDGSPVRIVMRVGEAVKRERLASALYDNGFPVQADKVSSIVKQVSKARFDETTLLTSLTGWHERQYLRPDGEVIGTGPDLIFVSPDQLQYSLAATSGVPKHQVTSGAVEEWIRGIAEPSAASSVLTFSLATSFAALLLRPIGAESGLFHLTSPESSKGKSTSLLAALSVHRRATRGELPTWDFTDKSMEESAALYCDSLLPLDEFALLADSANNAAARATKVAFTLAAGIGKGRSGTYSPMGSATWRLIALSTGETGISANAKSANRSRLAGDVARAVDCPLDLRASAGIFDRLTAKQSVSDLLRIVEQTACRHYGVAAVQFLNSLIADWDRSLESVRHWQRKYFRKARISSEPWERRFAARFALAYAAARLAQSFDLLPWPKDLIFDSISMINRDSRQAVMSEADLSRKVIAAISDLLSDPTRFISKEELECDEFTTAFAHCAGVMFDHHGKLIYAVKPGVIEARIGSLASPSQIETTLRDHDLLVLDHAGGARRQLFVAENTPRPRLYWLRRTEFHS